MEMSRGTRPGKDQAEKPCQLDVNLRLIHASTYCLARPKAALGVAHELEVQPRQTVEAGWLYAPSDCLHRLRCRSSGLDYGGHYMIGHGVELESCSGERTCRFSPVDGDAPVPEDATVL
jgi:hypothetical protein